MGFSTPPERACGVNGRTPDWCLEMESKEGRHFIPFLHGRTGLEKMETFTEPRDFVDNGRYAQQRRDTLGVLDFNAVDEPIVDIVTGFAALPHCFPLQSCVGHFICSPAQDIHSLVPLPTRHRGLVRYRIAYFALCIENSPGGKQLRERLAGIPSLDPANIQFGSADWFWDRWLNSYVIQVEPIHLRENDEALLEAKEALHIQEVRDLFLEELRKVLSGELTEQGSAGGG